MTSQASPKDTTIRKLFAVSMNRCAFPNCQTPIIDPQTNTILAEICHINAQKKGGPRFNSSQTDEERHTFENLILLCSVHHKIIDSPDNLTTYTENYLKTLKTKHEEVAKTSVGNFPVLTDDLLHRLQKSSEQYEKNVVHMDFRGAEFRVGGEGGQYGGGGGNGGIMTIIGTSSPPPGSLLNLSGEDGKSYGAGGGGCGIIKFVGRAVTSEDISSGLRISSIFTASAVTISEGFNVLSGGCSFYLISEIPSQIAFNVLCVFELGMLTPETLLRVKIEVTNPQGDIKFTDFWDFSVPLDKYLRYLLTQRIHLEVKEIGIWNIQITSDGITLANYSIEFRLANSD